MNEGQVDGISRVGLGHADWTGRVLLDRRWQEKALTQCVAVRIEDARYLGKASAHDEITRLADVVLGLDGQVCGAYANSPQQRVLERLHARASFVGARIVLL